MTADGTPVPPRMPVPPEIADRARRLAAGTLRPAATRDAATVVLLRDTADGVEAYLLRRVRTMAFAAGMYVFPGGAVDPRDEALDVRLWSGPGPAQWARVLSADEKLARALVCAAVRETFEESGVLLAGPDATTVVSDVAGRRWDKDRRGLLDRSLSLAALLGRRRLVLRADLLRPWAHWVTPEIEPRRYDTRFFVAAMPPGQATRAVDADGREEADRAVWLRPAVALEKVRHGEIGMLPPTIFTLAELAAYATVQDILAAGSERDIRPVLPRIVVGDADEAEFLLPGAHGSPG